MPSTRTQPCDKKTIVSGEKALRRRVVHVNRLIVRHVYLQCSERILPTRVLAQSKFGRFIGIPIDAAWVHLAASRVEHSDVHARQIARVLRHLRDDLVLDDGGRQGPGRVGDDVGDLGLHLRRLMILAADHGGVAMHDAATFHLLHGRRRDVHVDVTLVEGKVLHDGEPMRAGVELLCALARRNIERRERRLVENAGLDEAPSAPDNASSRRERLVPWSVRRPHRPFAADRPSIARRWRKDARSCGAPCPRFNGFGASASPLAPQWRRSAVPRRACKRPCPPSRSARDRPRWRFRLSYPLTAAGSLCAPCREATFFTGRGLRLGRRMSHRRPVFPGWSGALQFAVPASWSLIALPVARRCGLSRVP